MTRGLPRELFFLIGLGGGEIEGCRILFLVADKSGVPRVGPEATIAQVRSPLIDSSLKPEDGPKVASGSDQRGAWRPLQTSPKPGAEAELAPSSLLWAAS